MPTKKNGNGTRKNSTTTNETKLLKSKKPEIIVEIPPESSERAHATPETSSMERENLSAITKSTPEGENPLTDIEEYLINILHDLEKLHDAMCETKVMEIKMRRIMFINIATTIQKA